MEGSHSDLGELQPRRLHTLVLPNPQPTSTSPYASFLRIAVLDSPILLPHAPKTAAMFVPPGRESDWLFSTKEGHLQLLRSSSSSLSRLILIGDSPLPDPLPTYTRRTKIHQLEMEQLETGLLPFILALCPKSAFIGGIPTIPFLSYEDDVVRIVPVEVATGSVVGEMVVEEVELEIGPGDWEVRRRLRFRRMPNLVQTQVRVRPPGGDHLLVQPYLKPMLAGICLITASLEQKSRSGLKPRVLCLGVGGGSLLLCLRVQLGFDVVGVETDKVVLDVAKRHFGLEEGDCLRLCIADGIKIMKSFGENRADIRCKDLVGGMDIVMVDMDSGDAATGLIAPPVEFFRMNVLAGARMALGEQGILVANVVPLNNALSVQLLNSFREVFSELYEIDVGNAENRVIVAAVSPVGPLPGDAWDSPFMRKLEEIVGKRCIECIRKI